MIHSEYIQRCFDLARLGNGRVSPNPMVGAVLVYEGRIIGEGWHRQFGEAHAEVNCIRSVLPADRQFIPKSTLYCSLEPCFHFGKTPPCVDLILEQKIPGVVVSNTDPNPKVAGQSLAKLKAAGVNVVSGVLEAEGRRLNRAFFTWITLRRPFVILKWAQSSDGFLGKPGARTAISGQAALRLVHRWRSEADAILVGTNTALADNPRLDARFYPGKNPLRMVWDVQGKIPADFHLLDDSTETWVFGKQREGQFAQTVFIPTADRVLIPEMLEKLALANRAILFVEGGARVLAQFMAAGFWDEIRVIENARHLGSGLKAPDLPPDANLLEQYAIGDDRVGVWGH